MARSLKYCFRAPHGRFPKGVGPSAGPSARSAPVVGMYLSATERSRSRFRRRKLRARASPHSETMGPKTLVDGSVLLVPSDDNAIPFKEHSPLSLSPRFDSANSNFIPPKGDGRDGSTPNVATPKRSGVNLEALYPQRSRASSQEAKDLEELAVKLLGGRESHAQRGFFGIESGRFY